MAGGRPSKLTPEIREKLCEYVRLGMFQKDAARACGVSESTLHAWKQRGARAAREREDLGKLKKRVLQQRCRREKLSPSGTKAQLIDRLVTEEGEYLEFLESLEQSAAQGEAYLLALVQKGATDNTADAKWLLERINPRRYARRTVTELVGKDDGPVEVAGADSVRDRLKRQLEDIRTRKDEAPDLKVVEGGKR